MNKDQVLSIVRSVAKIVGGILAAHGATNASTELNTENSIETIAGLIIAAIALWKSHKSNSTTTPTV